MARGPDRWCRAHWVSFSWPDSAASAETAKTAAGDQTGALAEEFAGPQGQGEIDLEGQQVRATHRGGEEEEGTVGGDGAPPSAVQSRR